MKSEPSLPSNLAVLAGIILATLLAPPSANAGTLTFKSLTKMTNNGTNFNLSVVDGKASYRPNADTGSTAVVPIGDGTLLDWKLLGGSNLNGLVFNANNVGYANGAAAYINNPTSAVTATSANAIIYTPSNWGQVWYTSDPGTNFSTPADKTTFTVLNAGANATPIGPITGTVDISTITVGAFYIFAGGYQANTDYVVSISGPGQETLNASKNDVINANNNRVNSVLFEFTNPDGLYDTLTWTYKHNSSNSRGRFMGVAIDGPDTTPPAILTLSPANTATDVFVFDNLVATFNEPIRKGTGNIVIKKLAGDTVVETIDVNSSSVTINGTQLTIDPASDLGTSTGYYVEIASGAITDLPYFLNSDTPNVFAGVTGNSTWSFTTTVVDNTAPTLVSIDDDKSGGAISELDTVLYTVTFSEPMTAASVEVGDFKNGGSAAVTVNSVTSTGDPAVFLVSVNPDSAGTLQLKVAASAILQDFALNVLDAGSASPDDTIITVDPEPQPTLNSIVDNFGGNPVYANVPVAYVLTFSRQMDASTIDITDFENTSSTAITVVSVIPTTSQSVYVVVVTPTEAGTLQLQVKAGASLKDNTTGKFLNTTSAIPDDITLSVNAGPPPPRGVITVDGFASWNNGGSPISGTFDASASDKLVVIVTGENGNPGDLNGNCTGVTYDGVPLTHAVDRNPIGGTPFDQTYNDIWYLDNPTTSTGAIVASVNSRGSVTAFALSGTAPGVGSIAISPQASKSVIFATTTNNSIVIASHGMGGDGNTANVGSVDAVAPLIETSARSNGSSWDGHVTAYALVPTAGAATYSFTGGNLAGSHTIAAEFMAAVQPASNFAAWIANAAFGLSPEDQGFNDDPDGDGNGNGLENFFGTDPSVFTAGVIAGTKTGDTFTFTHPQNATPASDVSATYSWSTDLATFTAAGVADGNGTKVSFASVVEAGIATVTATVEGPPVDKLFVRVTATQN